MASLLAGCHHRKLRFSEAEMRQIRAETPGMKDECLEIIRWGGVEALTKPQEECYKFDPPRRWKGLALGAFETSLFCPEPAQACPETKTKEKIWLQVGPNVRVPASARDDKLAAGMFAVDFVGRKTSYPGGYGHLGDYDQEIIMDRLLSMKRVPMYSDAELAQFRARGVKSSCLETIRWGGLGSFKDPEECFEKLPPAHWRGLWRNDPEISYFCPAPATKCPEGTERDRISIDFQSHRPNITSWNGLYQVDFIGRRTARGGFRAGYGARQDMIVDRLISMKEIEPPPKN
jgi:hypothetical protein